MSMRKTYHVFLFCLMIFVTTASCFAQSKDELQKKVSQLEKDIKKAEKLLGETAKSKESSISEINLLKVQIEQRESLIKTYEQQISLINKEISKNKKNISKLQSELDDLRHEYAEMLTIYYKNRNNLNNLLFIFSSEDFNQAVRRMRYIREFNDLLKDKTREIEKTKGEIKSKLSQNEAEMKSKQKLLGSQKKEKEALLKDKKKVEGKIANLKKKESKIKKEIKQKNKEAQALQDKIKKIIEEEARRIREMKDKNGNPIDYQLSVDFENNKGRLPWPCDGIVTGKYGTSKHPTQAKVKINNHGIDISADKGTNACCVFDGKVSTVFNTGKSNVVMVRHGLYFTLYANLDKVFVKAGQKVRTGDRIGVVHTSATENTTVLHFEVWNDKNHTNPQNWLKP